MKSRNGHSNSGIALIIAVIVISFAAFSVLGIASYVASSASLSTGRAARETALYAAQAGVYNAIDDCLTSPPYWVKVVSKSLGNNAYFSAGKDANFLCIDASHPQIYSGTTLRNIPLRNLNNTQSITVNKVSVEWYNISYGSTMKLNQIYLGSVRRYNSSADSGAMITLTPNFVLASRQSFTGTTPNRLIFSNSLPKDAIVLMTFYFTDGSSRKACLLNQGRSGNNEFSITATGESRGKMRWKRTIDATYDISVNRITSWQETGNHI